MSEKKIKELQKIEEELNQILYGEEIGYKIRGEFSDVVNKLGKILQTITNQENNLVDNLIRIMEIIAEIYNAIEELDIEEWEDEMS
ncbi:MAG: hypothetical protein KAU62_02040, partial [Candidatus Heimdallarchaeota archaeon]|nr:hypothetical protein [Candidatus Heimdallarchaeota archaeon]MCK4609914.1 hypothetical protein [Candidatus Heimdallarchaeota archaeon]